MDPASFREQFPVFERTAYLNAGSCGPLPGACLRAAVDVALEAAEAGRGMPYFLATTAAATTLRGHYAAALGAASPADVALTTCTSEGLARMIEALRLQPGDEVLTAPDEHPGLLGPLAAARRHLGIEVRTAPLAEIDAAVDPARTKLVACSHVNWTTGALAPAGLADVGREIPVLLDGAQGAGAIDVDVTSLGCFAYAAAGQKWMCGPVGTGMLWVDPAWRERLHDIVPGYVNLVVPADGLEAAAWDDARAFDAPALSREVMAAAAASAEVLGRDGWDALFAQAQLTCDELVARLEAAGHDVAPRGPSTLVSWTVDDAAAVVERASAAGVTIRPLPGTPYVRASVGAWNDAGDLERLLAVL
ncbi:aminotransferase class V-fold PLP-dependent enzyme [Paraconexibacter antarcticus]|uniref:Aminotransferase class V-fold PLP-dependent enzyme n=1 Tax=Paraconexibacter antarcticus TaxID=2949664 RepID=A0ABY5DKP2_9ACTN|nr:aminotransferase class V-fold PLP-dependent enzyme [Paraconexibacter antarcticus]UTI62288.1 aminotransferase class V-fold PLP-dependent enzyme [Paraconexibacter antarcticus]